MVFDRSPEVQAQHVNVYDRSQSVSKLMLFCFGKRIRDVRIITGIFTK